MPAGLQVQNWFKQNLAGTANEALAPGTGDTNTFFNVPQGSVAYLAEVWAVDDANPVDISLVASRFHDQQSGIVYQCPDGDLVAPTDRCVRLSSPGIDQPIFPSDVLTVQVDGVSGDNVNVTLVFYYADIPGIAGRYATFEQVKSLAGNQVGIRTTLTAGAGNWGSSVALNASDNRLHANRDYAVLGFTAQAPLSAVSIQGVDLGNLRAGGPVLGDADHDGSLFVDLARAYNAPLIPVINSNNAGATLLQAAHPQNDTVVCSVQLVELPNGIGV